MRKKGGTQKHMCNDNINLYIKIKRVHKTDEWLPRVRDGGSREIGMTKG